jgi:hypothetical protein
MDTTALCGQWPYLLTLLPSGLDASARRCGALVRCREIPDAQALLRLLLAYGATDLSLKDVAAWSSAAGVAQVSGPGLFYRVRKAEAWLSELLASVLEQDVAATEGPRLPVRIVDATVLTGPGAVGTDWRAHVMGDAQTGGFRAVELTDASGGESFSRYTVARGDVVLGDRGYGRAAGIAAVHEQGAFAVARLIPQAIRLCTPERTILRCAEYEQQVQGTGVSSWDILLPVPPERSSASHGSWRLSQARDWIPARLLAARPLQQDVIWVLTTLPKDQATGAQVMDLYRVRWQVELLFKRLKSLLHLDNLPSRSGPTARSWILSRLLLAALGQRLLAPTFSPWGYRLREQG